jgi:hypothetical protein
MGYDYLSNSNKTMDMNVDLELEMKISHRELRVALLHQFRLCSKVTEATSNICDTIGKDLLYIRTAQHWFHWFKKSNFDKVETHLHELGKTWKYGVWIPYELSPHQLQHRVDASMELMTSHRNYQWIHTLRR